MMRLNKGTLVLVCLMISCASFGQNLRFRLVATDSSAAMNVKVVNIVTEKTAVSNASGEFLMEAKPDQMLVFPSENYEYKRYEIQAEDIKKKAVTIVLIPKPIQLDDVVVNKDISAEAMGFVPKGQKQYTPAERKVYTATSGPVDIVANAISGRTKMLKKQVSIEKKEALFEKLRFQFDDSLYIAQLRIPSDYIKGFQYFCIDDPAVAKALNAKNKPMVLERISQLAPTYLEMIAKEENDRETSGKP
ncbi:peptidase associated/transthyretin-like domain-containing protein [Flavobacterium selenitireducens]|uniref:hypothetical protein n=1 Tax=Flavobacterium selenitireducens TaxID=2722704 RepID=UPI00168B5533|nr:hypothetical protein [Flavobacterium selenitireducens]MBD3583252.1 carboxypeptidase-like regulatory domain-containing protein [Flavobacterium selenitireducens]